MKKLLITFLFSGITLFGFSQDSTKIASVRALLELTGSGNMGVQVVQNLLASYKKSFPNVPQEFWDDFLAEVNPDLLVKLVIPIYARYYSTDEINKLIEFYQTPLGKKIISTMPQVMQESMKAGQVWGEEMGKKVYDNLQKKGYVNQVQ